MCADYNGGGYEDWYLPSYYEMQMMREYAVVKAIEENSDFVFKTSWMYWTSTAKSYDYVWCFGMGSYAEYKSKTEYETDNNNKFLIRAVRKF